jgi:hypothetical protein
MSVQIQFFLANIPSLLFLGNRRRTDAAQRCMNRIGLPAEPAAPR